MVRSGRNKCCCSVAHRVPSPLFSQPDHMLLRFSRGCLRNVLGMDAYRRQVEALEDFSCALQVAEDDTWRSKCLSGMLVDVVSQVWLVACLSLANCPFLCRNVMSFLAECGRVYIFLGDLDLALTNLDHALVLDCRHSRSYLAYYRRAKVGIRVLTALSQTLSLSLPSLPASLPCLFESFPSLLFGTIGLYISVAAGVRASGAKPRCP